MLRRMSTESWIQPVTGGVSLNVKVQPRASRNEIGEVVGAQLKVRVTAPPVDAAANQAVVLLLAEVLGCSRAAVQLVRGATSRSKVIHVHGVTVEAVLNKMKK